MRKSLFFMFWSVLISFVMLGILCVFPLGCSKENGFSIQIREVIPPVLESFDIISSSSVSLTFDKGVILKNIYVEIVEDETEFEVYSTGDNVPKHELEFSQKMKLGKNYILKALAEDEKGTSLSFSVSFAGFNDNKCQLIIEQVRNSYSSKKNQYEYVKFYCLSDGNLSGLEMVCAGDGENQKFVFPPVEVKAGEHVTVHLRKMKNEDGSYVQKGMIDELEGNIGASFAVDSSSDSWDFWVENQKSRISPSDIIVLRDSMSSKVLDVLMFKDPKKNLSVWDSKYNSILHDVENSGLWLNENNESDTSPDCAFEATGITSSSVTKSICRKKLMPGPLSCSWWFVETAKK